MAVLRVEDRQPSESARRIQAALSEAHKLSDLAEKLREAEERNQRALSMAQQTKKGHVYVISNIGSFGEDVYKIGLTRRLEPLDRVRELGDASVPFPFDVHAMIESDDSPALETALHKRFVQAQVNKMNPRKEFFQVGLEEIRSIVEEMRPEGVKWTLTAEATQYRESLAIERKLKEDAEFRKRWVDQQMTLDFPAIADEDENQEVEGAEETTDADHAPELTTTQ
jgi:hypothetical protein